jgi:uncharacterized protein (DUF1786 family)
MTMIRRLLGGPTTEALDHAAVAADVEERIKAAHRLAENQRRLRAIDRRIQQENRGRG